jgi:opacity protein-like surface antigen
MSGFNLGAGYERRLGNHFGVRAEYLYDDFGHQFFRGDSAEWNDRRIAARTSTLRVGVDFRF